MQVTLSHDRAAVRVSPERWVVAGLAIALLAPVVAVAGVALGLRLDVSVLVAVVLGMAVVPSLARRLPREWDELRRTHAAWCAAWLVVAVLAALRSAGVAWFMADPQHAQSSAFWFDPFYVGHSCYSAYWQAAELARSGVENLYDTSHYAGFAGRFKIDEFFYLPQFLLLPAVGTALGGDFLSLRAAWFVLETALVGGAMVALCRWVGGAVGRRAALLLPAVWLASPVLVTLQLGNFQLAAIAMSVLAMVSFERGRPLLGGALLGFAVFKLFPGLLGIYLIATRQWRAVGWTLAFSALYTVAVYAWLGAAPFEAFVHYQAPRILSGEAWSFLWLDGLEPVVAINDSVPGLALKLDALGVGGMTPAIEKAVSWVWTLAVFALAIFAARRAAKMSRLELVSTWLALLALAAYRSPFVPDHNGLFAPIWLWLLVAAGTRLQPSRVVALAIAYLALSAVLPFGGMPLPELHGRMALSTFSQAIAIGLCLWVVLRRPLGEASGARASAMPSPAMSMG